MAIALKFCELQTAGADKNCPHGVVVLLTFRLSRKSVSVFSAACILIFVVYILNTFLLLQLQGKTAEVLRIVVDVLVGYIGR